MNLHHSEYSGSTSLSEVRFWMPEPRSRFGKQLPTSSPSLFPFDLVAIQQLVPKSPCCSCLLAPRLQSQPRWHQCLAQLVDLDHGGFQLGIELGNIHHFAGVFGLHVAADGQVVVVGGTFSNGTDWAKWSTLALLSNTAMISSMCMSSSALVLVSFLNSRWRR